MTLEEFEQLLRTHDWTYNYSDDHRAWTKGREEANKIAKIIKPIKSNILNPLDIFLRQYSQKVSIKNTKQSKLILYKLLYSYISLINENTIFKKKTRIKILP